MVTLCKIGDAYHSKLLEICGLSTDEKPVKTIEGAVIVNGSTFVEMDTKKVFMYSQSDSRWYEV